MVVSFESANGDMVFADCNGIAVVDDGLVIGGGFFV